MNNCIENVELTTFLYSLNWELLIATIAIIVSLYSLNTQRKHNKRSFKPIPVIVCYNYLNVIGVRLWNKGTGPLIIESLKIDNANNLLDLIPTRIKALTFVEYIKHFKDRAISPNDSLNLLEFKIRKDPMDNQIEEYVGAIQEIRGIINGLEIVIKYKDTYGDSQDYKSEPLDFSLVSDKEFSAFNKFSR